MRNRVIFYDWRIPKMPVLPRFMPIDANKVDWKNSSKILCMKDATRMSLYVCHHHPLWIADSGLWEGCLRCEGGGTEVWIWIWGQLLCSQIFPRGRAYTEPNCLFVCLHLCRLPFHWVHLFLSCSHVTGSLLNSLSISFYYSVHTCIHIYTVLSAENDK